MLGRVLLGSLFVGWSAIGAELVLDFGPANNESSPPGFTNTVAGTGRPGRWTVLSGTGPGGTNQSILAQTSMDVTDERFPLLVYQKTRFDDFTLTTKFKLVEGVVEQMAGIAFRYQDEKSFYVIRASGLGNNVRFYKVVGGVRSNPIGPNIPIPKGEWHELKIQCEGHRIRAWLDGQNVIPELVDTSFSSGLIAFWTKSDSLTYFADTRIVYTPRELPARALVRDTLETFSRLVDLKIFVRDDRGEPVIIASKDEGEIGAAGGASERGALTEGNVYCGREQETVSVIQPLRDRNGEPIAAVRVVMKSYLGQTDQAILQRALPIVKSMQDRTASLQDLQ